jgi:hypothetical protein
MAKKALAGDKGGTIASGQQSDHLVLLAAYAGWEEALARGGARAAREFAKRHALSYMTLQMLRDMRGQFGAMLADIRCPLLSAPSFWCARKATHHAVCIHYKPGNLHVFEHN